MAGLMTGLSFQEGSKLAEKLGTLVGPLPYSPVIVDYPSICSQFHIKEAGKSLPTEICYLFSLIQYSIYKVILNYKREPNLVVQCNEVFIFQFFSTVCTVLTVARFHNFDMFLLLRLNMLLL